MKNLKALQKNQGFTIIELLVVLLITGVVITAVYQLFSTTREYTKSVSELNDYQNITTEALYRLRVELADRASVESITATDTESDGTLKYDSASLNPNYGYIVTEPVVVNADGTCTGGGATIKGISLDAGGAVTRTPDEIIGRVDDVKPYRVQITFRSEDTGRTNVGVSIVRTDYINPATGQYEAKTVYTQSTNIMLRSGKPSTGQEILRYGLAS